MSAPFPLPRRRTVGQGINPNARDPQDILTAGATPATLPLPRPEGIGRVLGGQPAQPQQSPGDLSDLGPIQKIGLAFGDFAAGLQGRPSPSQQLMAQRKAEFEARRQQLLQGLAVLGQFQQAVDNAPPAQQAALKEKLRGQFEQFAGSPDAGELFDAVVGSAGLSEGVIAQLGEDEGAKLLLASGATGKDLAEYAKSEGFLARAVERQDQKALPNVERKLQGLLNSKDPEVQAKLKEIARDGVTTTEEVKQLNELATRGPAGTQLTQAELATLERQQDALAQRIPGFQTSAEFKAQRELRAKEESERRQAQEKAQIEGAQQIAVARALAETKPAAQSEGAKARDRRFAQTVYVPMSAEGGFADTEKSLTQLDEIIGQLESGTQASGPIVGSQPDWLRRMTNPESVAIQDRVGEVVQKNLRLILGAQFTEREAQALLQRSYNPGLSEEENLKRLKALRSQIQKAYTSTKAATDYFEKNNGTLEGFQATPTLERGNPEGTSKQSGMVRMRAPNGQEAMVPREQVEAARAKGAAVVQ